MLTFDIAGAQIDGARDYQEDAFLITRLSGTGGDQTASLVIVADGMGGHAAGNVASNMAVQTFNKHLTSQYPSDALSTVLREAVLQANNSITETVRETAALKGMGCTLVCALLEGESLRWVSVGDSHLYLIRGEELSKKNADHSYGGFLARMAEQGKPIEPEAGFSRNMLMSALTGDEIADIDCPETPLMLQPGDRVIVATDGLDTVSQGKLRSYMENTNSAKELVDALLKAVQEAKMPRQDNTTVVVIVVGEKAGPAAPKPVPIARLTNVASAPPPPPRAARIPVDTTPDTGGGAGKLITIIALLLMLAGGGGYWYWHQTHPAPLLTQEAPLVATPIPPAATLAETPPPPATPVIPVPPTTTAVTAPITGTGKTFSEGAGPLMVKIPAGSFQMGSADSVAEFTERPQHQVTLGKFAISVYEVTIAEYARFASASGRRMPKTDNLDASKYPVFFVSWNDALAYTQWLSQNSGHDYRLPTEAQWEYAARAGTASNYWWGRNLGENNAHCIACETGLDPRAPTRIGHFKPNPYGLFDTAGNVQEWVYDCYHDNYHGAPTDGTVFEGGDCKVRVVRGGAFSSGPKGLRATSRDKLSASSGNDGVGIRVVRID